MPRSRCLRAEEDALCRAYCLNTGAQGQGSTSGQGAGGLEQVIQTLDSTLVDELNGTRKFDVVTRKAALEAIMEEQDLGGSGNIDPVTAAKIMKVAGAQYMLMTTITDFVHGTENRQV